MSWLAWLGKRIIIGIVITGVGAAAWNWYKQGDGNEPTTAVHEQSQTPEATTKVLPPPRQSCEDSDGRRHLPSGDANHFSVGAEAAPLSTRRPAAPSTYGNDNWPANIRQLSRQDQRKRLYIYLPPNISMEEAERW